MKKFVIVDPATMRLVSGDRPLHWRDKAVTAEFHGRLFSKEEFGSFLSHECAIRGNKESTQKFVSTQVFNFWKKRGLIFEV